MNRTRCAEPVACCARDARRDHRNATQEARKGPRAVGRAASRLSQLTLGRFYDRLVTYDRVRYPTPREHASCRLCHTHPIPSPGTFPRHNASPASTECQESRPYAILGGACVTPVMAAMPSPGALTRNWRRDRPAARTRCLAGCAGEGRRARCPRTPYADCRKFRSGLSRRYLGGKTRQITSIENQAAR